MEDGSIFGGSLDLQLAMRQQLPPDTPIPGEGGPGRAGGRAGGRADGCS